MAVIRVRRQHHLGAKEARSTVEKLAKKLQKELDAQYHWQGSKLQFKRSGASGHIDVSEHEVNVEIKLGMLLTPLKGKIEKTIKDEIDRYLTA
jgi:putative polyhydroxyalkanoate system protein